MTRGSLGGVKVNADGGFGRVWEMDEPWAHGFGTWVCPGLFEHITIGTAR